MSRINTSLSCAGLLCLALAAVLAAGCGSGHDPADHGADAVPPAPSVQKQAAPAQKLCPVMGKPIDPNISVEYQGKKIYFCCNNCVKRFKSDPAKYVAKLNDGAAPTGSGEKGAGSDRK